MNKTGVIGLKFRCIIGHDCKEANCTKYLQPDGQEKFLFNVCDVDSTGEVIHITEGEMDTIVLRDALGEPTVGAPGTGIWQAHWAFHFHGYQRVLAWPDGDKAGKDWGNRLRKEIPNVEIVQMPRGSDVGELFLELGPEALRELAGVDDSTALEVAHV